MFSSHWTKHEYLCTECDTLMEITTYWSDEYIRTPNCPCPHQAIVKLGSHKLPGSVFESQHSNVSGITAKPLVKINSNPYN